MIQRARLALPPLRLLPERERRLVEPTPEGTVKGGEVGIADQESDIGQAQIVNDPNVGNGGILHLLNCGPNGLTNTADAREVSLLDEVRPEIWREPSPAKDEFRPLEPFVEHRAGPFGQILISE